MHFYCMSVKTGMEEKYKKSVLPLIQGEISIFSGNLHILKKLMRLKNGKEYFDYFFPGYVFLETEETSLNKIKELSDGDGFIRFLPSSKEIYPLVKKDEQVVSSILQYGSTLGIVPVSFDKGDKIVILDGPFKDYSGQVVAVNRRNKRINIQLDFMNGMRIIGLTYQEVNKQNNLNADINAQN